MKVFLIKETAFAKKTFKECVLHHRLIFDHYHVIYESTGSVSI